MPIAYHYNKAFLSMLIANKYTKSKLSQLTLITDDVSSLAFSALKSPKVIQTRREEKDRSKTKVCDIKDAKGTR